MNIRALTLDLSIYLSIYLSTIEGERETKTTEVKTVPLSKLLYILRLQKDPIYCHSYRFSCVCSILRYITHFSCLFTFNSFSIAENTHNRTQRFFLFSNCLKVQLGLAGVLKCLAVPNEHGVTKKRR